VINLISTQIKKFITNIYLHGFFSTLKITYNYLKFRLSQDFYIERKRLEISKKVLLIFNSKVSYGPFKGLKLDSETWWGTGSKASMILGLYEQEILLSITSCPSKYKYFINIGAANGYYAIGLVKNNFFAKSYCFELSEIGRVVIKKNAKLNNVESRLSIFGKANKNFYLKIPLDQLTKSVILIDVEGFEFELFSYDNLKALSQSIIYIEIHDFFYKNGVARLSNLKKMLKNFFYLQEFTTTSRDLSVFPELNNFTDNERWLLCSEGRPMLMRWIKLTPRYAKLTK